MVLALVFACWLFLPIACGGNVDLLLRCWTYNKSRCQFFDGQGDRAIWGDAGGSCCAGIDDASIGFVWGCWPLSPLLAAQVLDIWDRGLRGQSGVGYGAAITTATRRFSARPCGVLLLATGYFWPNPRVVRLLRGIFAPFAHASATALARFNDSASL